MATASTTTLKRRIKRAIDQVPSDKLKSLEDFVTFLSIRPLAERIAESERSIAAGKAVPWKRLKRAV